jgi:hypothetical protein
MIVDHVKLMRSPTGTRAILTIRDEESREIDLGRVGKSVSNRALATRAVSKAPGASASAYMRYSWERTDV